MFKLDLKEVVDTHWERNKFISLSLKRDTVKLIQNFTSFLDEIYPKITLRTRAYVIKNDITLKTLPKCKCGKYAAIDTTYPENGFRVYCGPECSRSDKTIDKNIVSLLDNYEFLYEEKITKQKSIEQIAKENNISTSPIVKYLKKYNLYQLNDARRRNNKANKILENKESLISLYENNTMQGIAETLGTTKSTVSRWFESHNIEAKASNSYERKIKKVSNEENELFNYIQSIYNEKLIQSNRSILNGKELDVYIPDKNIAIEYNGLYSHHYKPWEDKPSLRKDINYHLTKTLECEKQGIQLLHFYSDEWYFKQSIIENIIKSKLGLNNKIYARKCNVVSIDTQYKNHFLNEYHMQGEDKSSIKLGLEYNGDMMAIMTFAKSRFNKRYNWELTRFCVKGGISVVGGFSRLLKAFRESYSGSIVSYADRRYSNGNVYNTNGFELIGINKPSYYYVDKNFLRRFNRMKFQKKYIGAYDCTEYEKARELGYEKIFDCGTLAFGLQ
jgi:predicted transcriptional regulator